MAKSDILVRWKADTQNYDANMAKARRTLEGFASENLSAGGAVKQMTTQLVAATAKYVSFGAAVSGAMKVAKDAFMSCESAVDEWGKTLETGKSIYQTFVQSLNNADFSGFLSRIDEVVSKAREAYNAMDELGTRMTIINPERARLQAQATELKATIKREGADSAAGKAAQEALRALEPALQQSFKTESKLNYDAFTAEVDKKLAEAGIKLGKTSRDFLLSTFSSDSAYNRLRAGARGGISESGTIMSPTGGRLSVTTDTRNVNQKLLDLFTDEWRREYSPLLNAAFGARGAAASSMLGDVRYLKSGGGGGGGTGGGGKVEALVPGKFSGLSATSGVGMSVVDDSVKSLRELNAELKRFQEALANASTGSEYAAAAKGVESVQQRIDSQGVIMSLGIDEESKAEAMSELIAFGDELRDSIKPIEIKASPTVAKTGKETAKAWQNAAAAVQSVSGALGQLEDPSAKIAGIVGEAIASIALGYATATTQAASMGPWAWIAFAAAGLATMITTVAQIKNVTAGSFAEGGMVRGNTYSNDQIPIMANAGEIVLNRAMAGNLASQLTGGGFGSLQLEATISGEDLRLALNNNSLRRGGGEYVTTNFM